MEFLLKKSNKYKGRGFYKVSAAQNVVRNERKLKEKAERKKLKKK